MLDFFINLTEVFSLNLIVILLSAVPITELRGSIPLAVALGVEPWDAFFLALLGNFLPVIPLALALDPMIRLLQKIPYLSTLITAILTRTRKKSTQVEKYGALGLILFVAIPSPGTGVWTGSLLAYLLGIRLLYIIPVMVTGIIISGLLVTYATMGVVELSVLFTPGATMILVILLVLLMYTIKNKLLGK